MIDLLIGCAAGIFIGATGIGAGSILTPLLILRGHDPLTAVTTGLFALIAARSVGSVQHIVSGHWPATHALRVLIGGVAGAALGFVLVQQMVLRPSALRLTLGMVLLSIGVAGLFASRLRRIVSTRRLLTVASVVTGAAVATTSAGSGTLLGVLVFPTTNWRVHEFSAVSNVFGLLTGVIGIVAHSRFDSFDAGLLGYVTAGLILGIVIGVLVSRRIRPEPFALGLRALTIVLGVGLIMS